MTINVEGALRQVRERVEKNPALAEAIDKMLELEKLVGGDTDDAGDSRVLLPYSSDPVILDSKWLPEFAD